MISENSGLKSICRNEKEESGRQREQIETGMFFPRFLLAYTFILQVYIPNFNNKPTPNLVGQHNTGTTLQKGSSPCESCKVCCILRKGKNLNG